MTITCIVCKCPVRAESPYCAACGNFLRAKPNNITDYIRRRNLRQHHREMDKLCMEEEKIAMELQLIEKKQMLCEAQKELAEQTKNLA